METMQVAGQWFGTLNSPATSGHFILNLDRRKGGYSGTAILLEREDLPGEIHAITLRTSVSSPNSVIGHTDLINFFTTRSGAFQPISRGDVLKHFPHLVGQVQHAEIEGTIDNDALNASYKADGNLLGSVTCKRVSLPTSTTIQPRLVTWGEFKTIASRGSAELEAPLYRGQSEPWPIQTSFHRADRFDLIRFSSEDVIRLESAVTSVVDTPFQLHDNRHLGALLGIAQHHGFPTPLLDWTKSPYVAAYFACRDSLRAGACKPIVFRFDRSGWTKRNTSLRDITEPVPGLAFIEPLPLKNARLLPQQSVLVFCNVHDFEYFVRRREERQGISYLHAYQLTDSPGSILKDLRMMGVYAASLFPGLDGMCRGVFEDSIETA